MGYYERYVHQVDDKMYSRDKGKMTALSHQPAGGRAVGGGLRIGEMERDALLSHGISSFLRETFMERADKYELSIDNMNGMTAMANPQKGIYNSFASNDTIQYINKENEQEKHQIHNSTNTFSR